MSGIGNKAWGLVVACVMTLPAPASAQIGRALKERTARKLEQRKEAAETTLVRAADRAVDSTLEKTGRGVDSIVDHGAVAIDTALNRVEHAAQETGRRLAEHGKETSDPWAADLAAGRAVIHDITFKPNGVEPTNSSQATLRRLARALKAQQAAYLVEAHVEPSGDVNADLQLSQRRAGEIKSRLVAAGVPEARLFAVGQGSTRLSATGQSSLGARIEVARMQ